MKTRRIALLGCLAVLTAVWVWSAPAPPRMPPTPRDAATASPAATMPAPPASGTASVSDSRAAAGPPRDARGDAAGMRLATAAPRLDQRRPPADRSRASRASSNPAGRTRALPADADPDRPFDLDAVDARLRAMRVSAPAPRTPGRNLFEFAPDRPVRLARGASRIEPAPVVAALPLTPPAPPPPALTLSGIAEQRQGDQIVRTAIVSGLGQLFFLQPGQRVSTLYEVTAVGPDIVELRDLATDGILRLTLR